MKLILATTNPHKIVKLRQIFSQYFNDISPQSKKVDIEEDGKTFCENAEKKAIEVSKIYHCHAVATDGGVLIPALGNDWNSLLTKRFIGQADATDFDRIEALLELMKDKKGTERAILWNEAIALANDGVLLFSVQVEGDQGEIQETYNPEQYQPGIWQCTVTRYPQFDGKNFFELNEEERKYSEISWTRLEAAVRDFMNRNSSTANL
mgnify:FL=1